MAAKGLRREGERLLTMDEAEQHKEGMFMIGQVATLRDRRCTLAELHRDVSESSQLRLEQVELIAPAGDPIDIAIVGAACVFPDAPDLEAYWSNIIRGENAVREVPRERWDSAIHFGQGSEQTPSKWGGFLDPVPFDPALFGIPPRSLASIDPTQLLALHVANAALDDAGLLAQGFDRERTGVVFGAEGGSDIAGAYALRGSYSRYFEGELPPELADHLPKFTEDSFAGVLGNVVSGRIASRLDLRGPNYTTDAACASSLAALSAACRELTVGAADVMIAGGADLHNGLNDYLMFASAHALSPSGQCRAFDAKADGIALGEGVAAVVLKRLEDAERDGDRIYAVIKGIGASSDGKALGLTAPRKEGQIRAVERAYQQAGISAAEVGLVEAHGTGTVVGDRTELAALSDHFIASGALAGSCTLGSVKSQIGHTKCAAGMAGLIKAMLAVQRGVLLATKNLTSPNPGYSADSPFALRQSASPWTADVRHAGVSAFGFGGTNFHVVLSGHGELANRSYRDWPQELFVLRAHTAEELASLIARLEMSSLQSGVRLCELAASVAKADAPVRCTFVVGSLAELRSKLAIAREGMSRDGVFFTEASAGKLAMLIPGQGSQSPGMLADLFVAFPALRETLDPAYQASLFPAGAFTHEERERQQRAITDTRVAQPTLGMVSLGVVRLLRELGVEPALLAGHSYGELVALAVADAFDADTLRVLSAERGRCIAEAAGRGAGTMAAVRASIEHVREALTSHPDVMVANHNAPDQVVIAGSEQSIAEAVATLERAGLNARKIPVSCAFHSPLVSAARQTFAEVLARTELRAPSIPVYANATARAYPADANAVRDGLSTQLVEPVRFVEQIEAMYEAGARVFVEAGPGAVLTDLVGRILRGRPHVAVACGSNATQGLPSLLQALARLIAAGVQVNLAPLFADRVEPIELGVVRAPAATAWLVDGLGARPLHGELPDIAMRPLRKRVALTTALAAPTSDREGTVREFLRTTRELVDAQRQVLLRYLGSEVVPTAERLRSDVRPSDQLTLPKENVIEVLGEPVPVVPAISALDALVIAVGNRTGYPAEMLDPDLDLEADLGIDSIKRLEIVAELRDRMQLAGSAPSQAEQDAMIEKLASGKTMRALAQMLEELQRGPASVAEAAPPAALEPTVVSASELERYVVDVIEVPQAHSEPERVRGKRFVIAGDAAPIAQAIATLLRAHGAEAELVAADQPLGAVDGMIFLLTQDASHESIIQAFLRLQEAVAGNAAWLVAATALGGRFGHHAYGPRPRPVAAGVCGLLKSVAKEHPERHVRVVDLALEEDPRVLASHLFTELVATDAQVEVGWAQGVRYAPSIAKQAVAVPTDRIKLDKASVVLITGGARGITGQVAIEMARRYGCKLELVGRTALIDDNEPSELAEAQDPSALRKLLIARMNGAGPTSPAAIEAQVRQILAEREIRATLTAIERAGGHASYHSADVGDERSLNALIDRLQATHGRIDGVIHAAGRIEDKLLVNKTRESFARVFSTKVAGARTLIERLSKDARFFVFFSSVSSTFGNRGQTDYAAANDALDKLAHWLHGTIDGRVLSINWGPWRGIGMVGPELEREYNKRGIGLISPAQGIEHFFDELLSGDGPQAILTASHSGAFALGGAE
jgi:acyl transferase domain-containing protein